MSSFGKDASQLSRMQSFRQAHKMHQQARPNTQSGGRVAPYFVNQFRPSDTESDLIRVLRGEYKVLIVQRDPSAPDGMLEQELVLPYMSYEEHFHGTLKKSSICSAGPYSAFKDKREPCRACDIYWEEKPQGGKGPMSRRSMNAFTVLHFADYAKVPQIDRATGAVRTNDKGEPYTTWQRFFPYQRKEFEKFETRDWNILHWSLGFSHFNALSSYVREIARSCASCGGHQSISMEAWICEGCENPLIEPDTRLSPKEIEDYTSGIVRCGGCHHEGYLIEIVGCTTCARAKRADLFDVNLGVMRVTSPDPNVKTTSLQFNHSAPRPLDARFTEIAKPLPLDKIFTPTSMERQYDLFGGGGSRAPVSSGQFSRQYNRGQGAPVLGPGGKIGY